jgi:ribosomal protein L18
MTTLQKKGYGNSFAFDRGDRKYVGRVKAVIDSAVSAGLSDQKTEGA